MDEPAQRQLEMPSTASIVQASCKPSATPRPRRLRPTPSRRPTRPSWPRPLPTFGSHTAPRVCPRLGISPSAVPSAPPFGPKPTGTRARCFSTSRSGKSLFHDTGARCASTGLLFRPLVFEGGGGGPAASASCLGGSPANLVAPPPSPPLTAASPSPSASRQPFMVKTRGRSSSGLPTVSSLPVLASAFRSSLKTPLNYFVLLPLLPLSPSAHLLPSFLLLCRARRSRRLLGGKGSAPALRQGCGLFCTLIFRLSHCAPFRTVLCPC